MRRGTQQPSREEQHDGGPPTPGRPRGIRTAILSAVALLSLAVVIVGVLIVSLRAPEESVPGGRPREVAGPGPGPASGGDGGPAIAGTIRVAGALAQRVKSAHALFVIARRGPGPPFAVLRIVEPHFPLSYRLGPENLMMAGTPFEGEVSLSARLSLHGGAGPAQPGDLEGEHPGKVRVGAGGADIVIDRMR